jgi:hypothetical protein
MSSWDDIEDEAPDLARRVRERFDATLHKTMATLRRDGAPRISGTEVVFAAGGVWLGSMPGARKARDLQRDGRVALHSAPVDEKLTEGDAKIAGVAVEVTDIAEIRTAWPDWEEQAHMADAGAHAFRLDVTEIVLVTVEDGSMLVTSWHPGRGIETARF